MSDIEINPGFQQFQFTREVWDQRYYDYRNKWKDNPKWGIVEEYPLNLDVETTNRCNLSCPFCPRTVAWDKAKREHQPLPEEGDLNWDSYLKIIEEIRFGKVPAMKFNWRGEPTLYRYLPLAVKKAKGAGVMEAMINTNGTLLDEKLCEMLCEAGLDRIIFSVDSIDPILYRKARIGAELEDALEGIRTMIRVRKEFRESQDILPIQMGPYIRVQKVDFPSARNENFPGFFQEMGVDAVAIDSYKEKDPMMIDPEWEPLPCAQPFQRLMVTWKGDFLPCCQGNLFEPIGNISGMTVKEAWHSPVMVELRQKHSKGTQKEIPQCRKCEVTRPNKK